ncbi:hypothetical protein RRG08_026944 [Elysia crispata]|uniref:Morc S5 domain-containing protein n=1 Tax=Elysia crispata TaxID=231223 RepID=A0AAE1D3L8_9GAST|nr:hypothetical protein RRG08_026944 [Elysia crispata]
MASQQDGILRSGVDPKYLHANSTAHIWIFGAFAELIDNAYDPDVNASELWIDKLDYGETSCLRFLDNGAGMDKNKLHKMLSFGYCDKRTVEPTGSHKPIGHYGNGFKSGSMRIGKDALVFTRTKDSASIGFLSQTYLKAIEAESVIVPMVDYSLPNLERDQSQETKNNLEAILRYSLFRSEEQLKDELRALGKFETGTKIIISNLAQLLDGQLELDFTSDATDILCPEAHEADTSAVKNKPVALCPSKYKLSLREYCTILFLKPRMIIHIRGKKVRSKLVSTCLNSPEYLNYHPRNEKKSIRVTFGFTWEHDTSEDYGMMLYHRNRLIKAFERVGYQKQSNNAYGIGVVGVAEVDFLEPIHTKQDFIRNTIFNNAIKWFGDKLNDYWNDKKTSRTPSNTRSQRGGRTESRDPATNLTPPEREINLGILDNAQYPVNQNQTQQSDVSPISIKPNKPKYVFNFYLYMN